MKKHLHLLLSLCLLLAPAVARADDDLLSRIIAAPPAELDSLLGQHTRELDDAFLGRLVRAAVDKADTGDLAEGQREARLADYIDAYRKSDHRYAAVGQNALSIDLLRQRRFADAVLVETDVVKAHGELFRPHFLLGSAYFELGQLPAAVEELESATRLAPGNEEAHLELAYAYLRVDRAKEGTQEFARVLAINPGNGRARDAMAMLNGKVGTDQNAGPANSTAAAHFDKAETLFQGQHFPEAIAEYQQALDADPRLAKAAVYMGDAWWQLGNSDKAIAAYQQAIAINPRDRQAHRFLGDVYEKLYDNSQQEHYLDDAIAEYRKAVEADPTYQTAVDDLARAQSKKKP